MAENVLRALEPLRPQPFYEALSTALLRETQIQIPAGDLAQVPLPPYLRLNLSLLDADGRVIATGREAGDLRRTARLAAIAREKSSTEGGHEFERDGVRGWDFGRLPERIAQHRQGIALPEAPGRGRRDAPQ